MATRTKTPWLADDGSMHATRRAADRHDKEQRLRNLVESWIMREASERSSQTPDETPVAVPSHLLAEGLVGYIINGETANQFAELYRQVAPRKARKSAARVETPQTDTKDTPLKPRRRGRPRKSEGLKFAVIDDRHGVRPRKSGRKNKYFDVERDDSAASRV
jgi:hypothetical protein